MRRLNAPIDPLATLGWRLSGLAARTEWGAHRGHVSAVAIPTCEYKTTAATLAAGRYSGVIATGIIKPNGLSSVRIPFALER